MTRFNLDDYEPVEDRLARYWLEHPEGRIRTDLVSYGDGAFIVRAELWRHSTDEHPWATGWAEERTSDRGVNATSALENCETSAIGRALANAGYAPKGRRPSREEMSKAQRSPVKPVAPRDVTDRLRYEIAAADTAEALTAAKEQVREALTRFTIPDAEMAALTELRDKKQLDLEPATEDKP